MQARFDFSLYYNIVYTCSKVTVVVIVVSVVMLLQLVFASQVWPASASHVRLFLRHIFLLEILSPACHKKCKKHARPLNQYLLSVEKDHVIRGGVLLNSTPMLHLNATRTISRRASARTKFNRVTFFLLK